MFGITIIKISVVRFLILGNWQKKVVCKTIAGPMAENYLVFCDKIF